MAKPAGWIQRESGLYVPTSLPDEGVGGAGSARPTPRTMVDWVMAVATAVSVLVGFVSLAVAMNSLRSQNAALVEQRVARESAYASRVNWWIESDGFLKVQNGSPVRVSYVYLKADGIEPEFYPIRDIEPCTVLVIDDVSDLLRKRYVEQEDVSLTFSDARSVWNKPYRGMVRRATESDLPGLSIFALQQERTRTEAMTEGCAFGE